MKRMLDTKDIKKLQDLLIGMTASSNGDVTVGKNLEVDGSLVVNGAITGRNFVYYDTSAQDDIELTLIPIGANQLVYIVANNNYDYPGFAFIDGDYATIWTFSDEGFIYVTFLQKEGSQWNQSESSISILDIANSRLYRHDIVVKIDDSNSISFIYEVGLNSSSSAAEPINSLSDLFNLVTHDKYTCNGLINGKVAVQFVNTGNINTSYVLCADGSQEKITAGTVTDDVKLP